MFKLVITDLDTAASRAAEVGATHVVSLLEPGARFPSFGDGVKHLKIECADTERPDLPESPTIDHVSSILEFTKDLDDSHTILVHCFAGISRSTATAYLILLQHMGFERAREAGDIIVGIRNIAMPNLLIVLHGIRALGAPDLKAYEIAEDIGDYRALVILAED